MRTTTDDGSLRVQVYAGMILEDVLIDAPKDFERMVEVRYGTAAQPLAQTVNRNGSTPGQ